MSFPTFSGTKYGSVRGGLFPAARHALVQRHSTPWGVAWHALEVLDYDLNGESGAWAYASDPAHVGAVILLTIFRL